MDTPFIEFLAKKSCDAIICCGQEVHFDNLIFFIFSAPTRSIEEKKNLIQFFDARSESCYYQVILFLAFFSSINLM
jgi:hypothetical protein